MKRKQGRAFDELRPVTMTPGYIRYPEGSVLIETGNTKVLCCATLEDQVPAWKEKNNIPGGWVTAEYALLPRATHTRRPREVDGFGGRTQEIRRMIGRSLRAAVNMEALGPRTCIVDCDVLQADGGTRTASITGGYAAMALALQDLITREELGADVLRAPIAAVSVGLVGGEPALDLSYEEDSGADVDLNVVMNARGAYVEIQGTGERRAFTRDELEAMLALAHKGIQELLTCQEEILT
jgi:ribonuclease PH